MPPIIEYMHSGFAAITGGYRYRGHRIYPLIGHYVFADYISGVICDAVPDGGGVWQTNLLLSTGFNISSFGEDQDGEIYVCKRSTDGAVYRLVWRDTDGDGMADDWENAHGLDANDKSDAMLDPDGDGFTNLQEFIADTDPHDATSRLRITNVERNGPTLDLTFTSSANKLYRVDQRDDLTDGTWAPLTNLVTGTGLPVEVSVPGITNTAARFYRVRVLP